MCKWKRFTEKENKPQKSRPQTSKEKQKKTNRLISL